MSSSSAPPAFSEPVDRSSPLPLHLQVRQRLLAAVAGWRDESARFPTEQEWSERLGVSRVTVRRALASLSDQGLLRRTPGAGTYVVRPAVAERLDGRLDVNAGWQALGVSVATRLLTCERRPLGPAAADLDRPAEEEGLLIQRLRLADDLPVAFDERWLPAETVEACGFTEADAVGSISSALRRGLPLAEVHWRIGITEAGEVAPLLGLEPADIVLVRRMRYLDADGRCRLAGRSLHHPRLAQVEVRLPLQG